MDEAGGKFNFGISTLERIDGHIKEFSRICTLPHTLERQRLMMDKIKVIFIDYAVLLSLNQKKSEVLSNYSGEVDMLTISLKIHKGKRYEYFDAKKETRMFQILREVSIELSPYFMPKKEDDEDDY